MPDEQNLAIEENRRNEKDTIKTGSDLPNGDGTVSDEDMKKISGDTGNKPTGQDHSTENYEESEPRDGVGGVQRSSDTESDVAHFKK